MNTFTKLRTNTKEFKAIINAYLVECLQDIDNNSKQSEKDIASYSFNRFKAEHCNAYEVNRIPSVQKRLADFLQGLPFQIDFENYKILELVKEWRQLAPNATEKQEDKLLSNWWHFIAYQIVKFWERNGINIQTANNI